MKNKEPLTDHQSANRCNFESGGSVEYSMAPPQLWMETSNTECSQVQMRSSPDYDMVHRLCWRYRRSL